MDWFIIVLLVAMPVLVIAALAWSASLRGPAVSPGSRKDSGEVPEVIPDEYAYERRLEEERGSQPDEPAN